MPGMYDAGGVARLIQDRSVQASRQAVARRSTTLRDAQMGGDRAVLANGAWVDGVWVGNPTGGILIFDEEPGFA
jgi:hypothetical protein